MAEPFEAFVDAALAEVDAGAAPKFRGHKEIEAFRRRLDELGLGSSPRPDGPEAPRSADDREE